MYEHVPARYGHRAAEDPAAIRIQHRREQGAAAVKDCAPHAGSNIVAAHMSKA